MQVDNLKQMLNLTKDAALNKVLITIVSILVPALFISFFRIVHTGFAFHYAVHLVIALVLVALYLARNKIRTKVKGIIFLLILFTMAVSGLFSFGLYSFAYAYFIPATAIAFLYFNRRTGWNFTIICLLIILIAGYLFRVGILQYAPESGFMETNIMWFNMIMTIALVSIAMTMFWNNMYSMLTDTFEHIINQQAKMKKMNAELIVARDKAEESDRLKTSFLRNISHEIRTPLNIIIGFSGVMSETKDPETIKKYNEAIWENSDNILKIINDIVDFSEIETNTFSVNNQKFNINPLLVKLEKDFQNKLGLKPISLHVEKMDFEICSDKSRLEQVLFNLLDNALKFTPKGTIKLNVQHDENSIHFSVSDTGIGIAPNEVEKIFMRFYKVNTFSNGAGLGLSISKSIARMLGGEIKLESELQKGSVFTLVLPVTSYSSKDISIY